MKLGKVVGLSASFLILVLFSGSAVRAGWGHLTTLSSNTNLRHYALIEDVVLRSEIRYCYETDDLAKFPPANLLREIPGALRVWTSELERLGANPVALT